MKVYIIAHLLLVSLIYSMADQIKGEIGEEIAGAFYKELFESTGWERIPSKYMGNKGIDLLFVKRTSTGAIRDMLICEVKYGKSRIEPPQMSYDWIVKNLKRLDKEDINSYIKRGGTWRSREFRIELKENNAKLGFFKLNRNGKVIEVDNTFVKSLSKVELKKYSKGNYLIIPYERMPGEPEKITFFRKTTAKTIRSKLKTYLKGNKTNYSKEFKSVLKQTDDKAFIETFYKTKNKINEKERLKVLEKTKKEAKSVLKENKLFGNVKANLFASVLLSVLDNSSGWWEVAKGEENLYPVLRKTIEQAGENFLIFEGIEVIEAAIRVSNNGVLVFAANVGLVNFIVSETGLIYSWRTNSLSTAEFVKETVKNALDLGAYWGIGLVVAALLPTGGLLPIAIITVGGWAVSKYIISPFIDELYYNVYENNYVFISDILGLPEYVKKRITPFNPPERITPFNPPDRVTPFNPPDRITPFNAPKRKTPWN